MRVLIALGNEQEEALIRDAVASRVDVVLCVVGSMAEARVLFESWKPDVAFLDPATLLGDGAFSGTRSADAAAPQLTAESIMRTGFVRYLQGVNPVINLVFVSDSDDFMRVAMNLRASGYLSRPLTSEQVLGELGNLRNEVASNAGAGAAAFDAAGSGQGVDALASVEESILGVGLAVRAFGNFEAFFNGNPIKFKHGKTRELLAYLVDRHGAFVDNNELLATLWEDENRERHASYLRTLKLDLVHTLEGLGCADTIVRKYGSIACVPALIKCDYFMFLSSKSDDNANGAKELSYRGEYMNQYGWGEVTNAYLRRL